MHLIGQEAHHFVNLKFVAVPTSENLGDAVFPLPFIVPYSRRKMVAVLRQHSKTFCLSNLLLIPCSWFPTHLTTNQRC